MVRGCRVRLWRFSFQQKNHEYLGNRVNRSKWFYEIEWPSQSTDSDVTKWFLLTVFIQSDFKMFL